MKLRMRGDSIRLRLSRIEVDRLRDEGRVAEAIRLPGKLSFRYALETHERIGAPTAEWTAGELRVLLPAAVALDWARSEKVAIEGRVPLEESGTLTVLVEKDFPCQVPAPGADDADTFDRPAGTTDACLDR